jgi:hypothetical protein
MEKKKIGIMCICLNSQYWPFAKDMIESAKQFLLTNHEVEFMLWTDMPDTDYGATIFPTEPEVWPLPTLMRYHLFLKQEEYLKKFDYIFYTDIDMKYVGEVGDEILGKELTMAQHPMYALDRKFYPPYEPDPHSSAFIPRFGRILNEEGKPRLEPLYAAGGFQGGETKAFIKAMKGMKETIDKDFLRNYVAIWNDESHWNKYLNDHPKEVSVVLSPSYIYPDSMIDTYYVKIWGRNYEPKIVTLTKKFSVSKEGGDAIRKVLESM